MAEYTPGYVEVPGKGRRYRNASGEYFNNHLGSILNSFKKAKDGVGDAYNNYYNSVADAAGTERRDGSVAPVVGATPKAKNQAAPAEPAEKPPYRSRRQGLDATYPDRTSAPKPEPQKPEKPGARVNANGLVSYGKDLSSLNAFTKAFTGGELTDIKSAFQSEDLPTAYQTGSNTISTEETPYELPEGASPSPLNKGLAGTTDLDISDTTYKIGEASVPGTIGRLDDVQEGASAKPDIAESVRTIRMHRNKRDQLEGFSMDEPLGGPSETKGNGMNAKRRAIRSAFLDMDTPIIQASVNANRIAGYGKNSDGQAMFNYGGELVQAKEGMQQKAKNAAMMGQDPTQFLQMKVEQVKSEQTPATLTPRNPSTAEKPSDPVITDSSAPHPDTGRKPDAATEQSNREYGAMQFKFDPEKGMMVPVK